MDGSDFSRLIYSDGLVALNGLCTKVSLPTLRREKYYNKCRCVLDPLRAGQGLRSLCALERELLDRYDAQSRRPVYRLADQLRSGSIKLFCEPVEQGLEVDAYLLRISGVWSTSTEYGLTHKFLPCHG